MIVTASYTVKCVFQIFTSGDLFLHHLSATSHNLWIINHRVRQSENGSFSFISFHLDSLLMTRISAPFSSFSRWLSDLSSVKIWDDEGKEMKLGKIKWSQRHSYTVKSAIHRWADHEFMLHSDRSCDDE